jgi:serine/threonine-protein kinase
MVGSDQDQGFIDPGEDALLGRVLAGRYDILRLLGAGGMGRVYEGRQRALDRAVAVKCIHPHLLSSEPTVRRFMEEARVLSHLVHPNIVKIYDFGRTDPPEAPTFYLVMELLTGPSLADVIADSAPLPVVRTHSILRQVLSALGEAHARGITHRDAKPDNVILEPTGRGERAKVIDFGIAKVHGARGVTAVGHFVGTPQYMPPEQIRGEGGEVSSDLYGVGVMMFQMLTGRLPFDAETVTEVLEQQLYAARPDPRDVAPRGECSAALAEVCLRAIDLEPSKRFLTADAFVEALDAALAEVLPPQSRRSPYPGPRPSPSPPPPHATGPGPSPSPPPPHSTGRPIARTVAAMPPPGAEPPRSGTRGADLALAERIERTAEAHAKAGFTDAAIAELRRGLDLGARWLRAGEAEAGGAALTGFGRNLGARLREAGRLGESERALEDALAHAGPRELGRARILAELATTLAARGCGAEAEERRLEALRIAGAGHDRELTARLRGLAPVLALAAATRGTVAVDPESHSSSAPPRRSEWRLRPERGGAEEEGAGDQARRRR